MFCQFPKEFSWGSAVWAQGTEGAWNRDGKGETVFEHYYKLNPKAFFEEVGPYETLDWYDRYREYIAKAAELNQKSFRTSISWARLMPDGRHVSEKARDYYENMFREMKKYNMQVFVVLYWFDMPVLYEEKGGFGNREIFADFIQYCKNCFECFNGLVDIWYVFNEPGMDTSFKYLNKICWPNRQDIVYERQAAYNMVVAHAMVVKIFKEGNYIGQIGSVINDTFVYPRCRDSDEDRKAAWYCETLYIASFMKPMINGGFPEGYFEALNELGIEIKTEQEDEKLIRENTIDVVGINYYSPDRVQAKCKKNQTEPIWTQLYEQYEMPGRRMNNSRGWEIYPKALYDTLMKLKTDYKNIPCYISENGIGIEEEWKYRGQNGQIQDDYRINFIKEHLEEAFRAITEGVNLRGYHVWSFVDLWSPTNQFKNLYGLVEFNQETKEIRNKKSALWYAEVIQNNGIHIREDGNENC